MTVKSASAHRWWVLLLALFVLGCGSGSSSTPTTETHPTEQDPGNQNAPLTLGVDVSHFSGTVTWSDVYGDGYRFAFTKATEGDDWVDPTLVTNMSGMAEAGIVRGAYHFYVTSDAPDTQARNFIDNVSLQKGDLPPVVDVESIGTGTDQTTLATNLRTFLTLLENHYGIKPVIYTDQNFWNANFGSESFADYKLWLAQYEVDTPTLPNGWSSWWIWQYAENQSVAGIEKDVDLNRYPGTLEDLKRETLP
ncbi:hypothetical protein SCOR_32540 [Sulfidibacter corallicola]|uniref:Lysozyme n=1 Tax=Sulfidibacter corallicola TaxID=2818388 RepID=A0A8A4TJK6_SULCO|nr:GH25 family lysozyme [Sulfidibacter corallicola]QTD49730.1 hypothetical protein J3U87_29455 [Sulfidibacter corallicola]